MKLFAVKNYKSTTWNQETGKTNAEYVKGNPSELSNFIKENNVGLHERLDSSKNCVFFGDLDHYTNPTLFNKFRDVLSEYMDVPLDDIKYTLSKKDNELSYHWTIPTIETNFYTLKEIMSRDEFKEFKPDLSVYSNRWFRLPNQSNIDKPHKHNIINGDEEDFIIHNLNKMEYTTFIKPEEKKEIKQESKPVNEVTQEIEKLLSIISDERADDFESWRNIGFVINNELGDEGYQLFKDFSKRCCEKFDEKAVYKFYSNIKKKDSGLKLGSLHKWAKEDNEEEYNELFPKKLNKPISDYDKLKQEFELKNFKLRNPNGYVELSKYDGIVIRDKKNTKDVYQNMFFNETITDKYGNVLQKEKSFIDEWLNDKTTKTYEKLDFRPCQQVPEDIFNLFEGFEAEKKQNNNINIKDTKLYEHLFNLCGREEASLEYTLNWLANIIQHSYKLTTTALIFRSVQGCGKDTFFNWFGNKIIGREYYFNDSKTDLVFGRFNSSISKKLLVVINEINQKETHNIIDAIKDATTKETNKIEVKGREPRFEQNNIHYIYLTNNDNPLPIEESDRRFVAFECNKDIAQDTNYFNDLYNELESNTVDKAFYDFLKTRNIEGIDFSKTRPKTTLYKTMKQRNMPVLAHFLNEVVDSEIKDYSGLEFYEHLTAWLHNNGYKDYKYTNTKFGIDIKSYPGIEKDKQNGKITYKLDKPKLKAYLIKNNYYE
jgi:hypothetical protein